MSKDIINIPKADVLMGSLRSMGYTFESAVADVIDNSISANANTIHIMFPTNPIERLAVGILDNGCGMTSDELFEAMRYGSTSSEEIREDSDLGRFGLGLKSASLSQCRILTVISAKDKKISAYSWDYNHILEEKDWYVKKLTSEEIEGTPYAEHILNLKTISNGTLVVWEDFDILSKSSDGQVYGCLNDLRSKVDDYISLIFHRYISSSFNRVTFYVNQHKVTARDPFLETNEKTTFKKEISISLSDSSGREQLIKVKPFVLPFATDLKEKDKKLLGGIENMRSQQGFYVYRNRRLIIWGTWFGMRPRGELTKNARIRVDIPNALDDKWSIDIKKQTASIPKNILNQLRKTVTDTLETSVSKHTYRGRCNKTDEDVDFIWDRMNGRNDTYYYKINRDSKLFQFVKNKMSDEDSDYLELLVTEIENNFPIQQMYIDKSNEAVEVEESSNRLDDIYQTAITMISQFIDMTSCNPEEAINNLMRSEPFYNYPKLREMLNEYYKI